jgi:sec-independent protein translocase protein TatC
MTLSEHLQELRRRLIYSLAAIAVAFIVCLFFQDELMGILTRPHRVAMENLHRKNIQRKSTLHSNPDKQREGEKSSEDEFARIVAKIEPNQPEVAQALKILGDRQQNLQNEEKTKETRLRVLKYQESFMNYLKVCIIAAVIIASPFILLQIWKFVSAGLYKREKKAIIGYIPFSYLLFATGVAFGYFFLVPLALYYLAGYGSPEIIEMNITLEYYLSFFLMFTIALGFVFQTPLVMIFLAKVGAFSPKDYAKVRKYVVVAAFIIGAAITPGPDIVSQILVSLPLLGLYELGIALSRISVSRKAQAQAQEAQEEEV